jgi:uroporphyrinogen decarboxylase
MNTWERFRNTVDRKAVDHVPTALIGTSRFFASITHSKISDLLFNPDQMINAQRKTLELFPEITFIPGAWPDYGVAILSAYGCRIFWCNDGMPQIEGELIQNEEDLSSLHIPNPHTDGLMPLYLFTLGRFVEQKDVFRNSLRFVWSFGPGELASYFCGITKFFLALINDKKLAVGVLEKVTQGIITWTHAQMEINPYVEGMLLTDDIAGMVSKDHYEEFIFPFHKRIREAFPNLMIVFHNDAKSDHILSSIADTGFEVFNLGKTTDIKKCRQTISDRMCVMGNIDPLDLMINGTQEHVYQQAKECLSIFSGQPGYILSVGGGLNQGTSIENIRALSSAAKEFQA